MKKFAAAFLFVLALCVLPAGPSIAWSGHGGGTWTGGGWHGGGTWSGGGWHGGGWHGGGWGWNGGWHGTVVVGAPWWGWGWGWGYPYPYAYAYPYASYPYAYYPPPYAYPYASVASQGPSVYVQQSPPAPSVAGEHSYWYYCASAKAYYPKVESCAEAWIKVPPTPQ